MFRSAVPRLTVATGAMNELIDRDPASIIASDSSRSGRVDSESHALLQVSFRRRLHVSLLPVADALPLPALVQRRNWGLVFGELILFSGCHLGCIPNLEIIEDARFLKVWLTPLYRSLSAFSLAASMRSISSTVSESLLESCSIFACSQSSFSHSFFHLS